MGDNALSDAQVERFHEQIAALVKKYQFRDRHQILGCGISVSQCYMLETLARRGTLTVNELASEMYLSVSTVTRVVDQLVHKEYVTRTEDPNDRRVRNLAITDSGKVVFQASWERVFKSEKMILEQFPAAHRDVLIDLLNKLNDAVAGWHQSCTQKNL